MRIFHLLLRLYPPEHQAIFAPEMLDLLKETAYEQRRRGWNAQIRFVLKEGFGLLTGATAEWIAKLTRRDYVTNQRPPGQTEQEAALPAEVVEAQKLVQSTLRLMDRAIANHQFEKARFYSYEERKAREHLRLLQQKYNIVE
jgi:hypothetical protein